MIRIQQLTSSDASSIFDEGLRIIHETQGKRSAVNGHVYHYATGSESCAFGAFFEEKLIGVATAIIRDHNEYPIYKEAMSTRLSTDSAAIGFMRSMSVLPSFQGKGIGKALVQERLKWMTGKGVGRAWVMSWINGKKFNSENVYRSMNFELIKIIPNFYQSVDCLVCGDICKCSTGIYVLDF